MSLYQDYIHITIKPKGAICNLTCPYCYYLKKKSLYESSSFEMSIETFRILLDNIKHFSKESFITWQGGEPSLRGLEFFKEAVKLQRQKGLNIKNAFQTNATLLNEEWIKFFKENDFLLGVSIDGREVEHSKNRKTKDGNSYFEKVVENINLMKKYGVEFNTLTTVNKSNVNRATEIYNFLTKEVGSNFLQFIPIVQSLEGDGFNRENKLHPQSISAKEYASFMIQIFNEWEKEDIGKVFVQLFDVIMSSWLGKEHGLCVFQKSCGRALCLEHNGDLYLCDHFVDKDFFLGNIHEKTIRQCLEDKKTSDFERYKVDNISNDCLKCKDYFICHGECPKNWIIKGSDGKRKNYLCEGYKEIFDYMSDKLLSIAVNLSNAK